MSWAVYDHTHKAASDDWTILPYLLNKDELWRVECRRRNTEIMWQQSAKRQKISPRMKYTPEGFRERYWRAPAFQYCANCFVCMEMCGPGHGMKTIPEYCFGDKNGDTPPVILYGGVFLPKWAHARYAARA